MEIEPNQLIVIALVLGISVLFWGFVLIGNIIKAKARRRQRKETEDAVRWIADDIFK